MDSKSWQWFGGGFALGVVIIGIVWFFMGYGSSSPARLEADSANESATSSKPIAPKPNTANPATIVTEAAPMTASGETVTVNDQEAGSTAIVSSVSVMKSTWVAIKDTSGRVLGARRADASSENLEVVLLRPTEAGNTYQAVLYVDDGDREFDLHTDTLVVGSEDAPVSSTFTAL